MAIFRYQAVTVDGKKINGMVNADSVELAKERLRIQKILVTQLSLYKGDKKEITLSSSMRLTFTRDLALLLRAKLPLYECLLIIEEKYRDHKAHSLLLNLCDQVKHGSKLSLALQKYPKSFNQVYITMIKAAEESGALESIFDELSKLISKQEVIKKRAQSAMIYPAFLGCFCIIILVALFFFLIPSMQELFEGKNLHPLTQIVLSMSQWLNQNGVTLLLFCLTALFCTLFFFRRPYGRRLRQKWMLHFPIIKRLITQSVLFRFSRVFSTLLSSGVPMLEALTLSKQAMNHYLFENVIRDAEKKIIEGKSLSSELQKSLFFPKLFIRMLAIAEEAGNIPTMLSHIGDVYEDELEKSLTRLTSLLQPVMLLFLGVIIGVILLAVLLPLTDVNAFLN